jgi:hypothetical protein
LATRAKARAFLDLRSALVAPNFDYKQALKNLDDERQAADTATLKSSLQYKEQQFQEGYNETANAINEYGADYLWHDIKLDEMPDDTDFHRGRRYAVIQYRSVWDVPPPKRSFWDDLWDAVSTVFEVGLEIAPLFL